MKSPCSIRRSLWIGASVLILLGPPVLADQRPSMPIGEKSSHRERMGDGMDWMQHTRSTLTELKDKLSLTSDQMPAWETWSKGVTQDAHQQLESNKDLREEKMSGAMSLENVTTPEQMTRGIQRMHAEIDWMQGHVVQLEAAQARTQTLYETLDTKQKTIFDLFWHEMYHRSAGHDEDRDDDEDRGIASSPMMRNHEAGGQH